MKHYWQAMMGIALVSTALTFTACGDDDDDEVTETTTPGQQSGGGDNGGNNGGNNGGDNGMTGDAVDVSLPNLVGVWQLIHAVGREVDRHSDGSIEEKTWDESEADLSWEAKKRITIKADGSYLMEDQKSDNATWRLRESGTLRVADGKLYVANTGYYSTWDGESVYHEYSTVQYETLTVKSLTSTQVVLYIYEGPTAEDDDEYEETMTFKRVY